MDAKFVQNGVKLDYTPDGSAVVAGEIIPIGDSIAVSNLNIADGDLGAITTEGVYEMPKATGSSYVFTFGDRLFWDVSDESLSLDAEGGANKFAGLCVADAGSTDTSARVKLAFGAGNAGALRHGTANIVGTGAVTTGLSSVLTVALAQKADLSLNANGVSHLIPTQTGDDAGKFTLKVWKPTAANDCTPVASTQATLVGWMAIGIA